MARCFILFFSIVLRWIACIWFVFPSFVMAQEEDWGNESDSVGFAQVTTPTITSSTIAKESTLKLPSVTGIFRSDFALWTERFDEEYLAKARQNVDLKTDYKIHWFRLFVSGHAEYDPIYDFYDKTYNLPQNQPTRDEYKKKIQLRESFTSLSLSSFEFSFGRQIFSWGEGEMFSPIDVVNPRDMREPGQSDLEDIRLPILLSRMAWFISQFRFEGMIAHESNFGFRSPPFGPFSPLPTLLLNDNNSGDAGFNMGDFLSKKIVAYEDNQEQFDLKQQQYFYRTMYYGSSFDLGVYAASVLHQQGIISMPDTYTLLYNPKLYLELDHPRYELFGSTGVINYDTWLFRWELVFEHDKPFNTGDNSQRPPIIGKDNSGVFSGMFGLGYSGFKDAQVSAEISKVFIEKELALMFPAEKPSFSFRMSKKYLHDRLNILVVAMMMGKQAELGWLARAQIDYSIIDAVKLYLGYITYHPGKELGPFSGLETHDRLLFGFRWDFHLL